MGDSTLARVKRQVHCQTGWSFSDSSRSREEQGVQSGQVADRIGMDETLSHPPKADLLLQTEAEVVKASRILSGLDEV